MAGEDFLLFDDAPRAKFTVASDSRVAAMSEREWSDYQFVLKQNRVSESTIQRLRDLRLRVAGKTHGKGGQDKWAALKAVAPIAKAALTVANFTPLSPLTSPISVGWALAEAATSKGGVSTLAKFGAGVAGLDATTVEVIGSVAHTIETGKVDVKSLSSTALSYAGVPPGSVPIEPIYEVTKAAAAGNTKPLTRALASAAVSYGANYLPTIAKPIAAVVASRSVAPLARYAVASSPALVSQYNRAAAVASAAKSLYSDARSTVGTVQSVYRGLSNVRI